MFEGKPQLCGTQYDWDESGEISPLPIENPDQVDERRAALGLIPLAENTKQMREGVLKEKERRPRDCGGDSKNLKSGRARSDGGNRKLETIRLAEPLTGWRTIEDRG